MELMNLKEEKVGDNLEVVVTGKEFLNRTLQAQLLRTTINKWDIIKLKDFSPSNNTIIWIKQKLRSFENNF